MQFNRSSVASLPGDAQGTIAAPGTAIFIDKDDNNWYIVGGFDFNLATYNVTNITVEHAFLRANRSFELNATSFVNTNNRATNMSCYNTSHNFTFNILDNVGLSNFNVSDKGIWYNECGNITILRTQIRTNFTTNNTYLQSNDTIKFNVTDDSLTFNVVSMVGNNYFTNIKTVILNDTNLYGNINFTDIINFSIYNTSTLNATGTGYRNGSGEGRGANGGANVAGGGGAYGGVGGISEQNIKGGNPYGDPLSPFLLGSPGGYGHNGANTGQSGGGAIYINV